MNSIVAGLLLSLKVGNGGGERISLRVEDVLCAL